MEWTTIVFLFYSFVAFYVYFLFLLIYTKNKKEIFSSPKAKKIYSISFVIPAYNEEETISNTISAILNVEYPGVKEIIIVNDGSTDRTADIVKELMKKNKKIRLINKKNSGKADSINRGIEIAKSELIAVVDADSYPAKDSIRKLAGFFDNREVGAVTSAVLVRNRKGFVGKLQAIEYSVLAFARKLLDFIDSVYVTPGPLSIYRKSLLRKIGGFDSSTVTEDIEIAWHIISEGYKVRMCLAAKSTTEVPTKFKHWWNQRIRWGVGGLQVMFKYKKAFLKKGLFGFFIMPFILSSIILSIVGFAISWYLIIKWIVNAYLFTRYSFIANTAILTSQQINLNPTILIIFLAFLLISGFSWTLTALSSMGETEFLRFRIRNLFIRLFYMLVYLTFYPLIWFASIYRIATGKIRWGTK